MIIDFDKRFRLYLGDWLEKNAEKFESPEEMENMALEAYDVWLNESAEWLDGKCPNEYFSQFEKPEELLKLLVEYLNTKVGIPDLLLDEISKHGHDSKKALSDLFNLKYELNEDSVDEARTLAVNLLSETDDSFLYDDYIDIVMDRKTNDEFANLIIERLSYAKKDTIEKIISKLDDIDDEIIETRCMDILVNFSGDERIYKKLISMFNQYTNTSLLAAYLGKYGDERAVNVLKEALDWEDINFLDYIEIRNSIEALGKDVDHERKFEGDTYYESLKNIE